MNDGYNMLIDTIEKRIDEILSDTRNKRIACSTLTGLAGYFSSEFLENSYFVVTSTIPLPVVDDLGMDELVTFSRIDPIGITYKDTYFVKSGWEEDARLHCHELVHVAQWRLLGSRPFMMRYLRELLVSNYPELPLEKMAHEIDFLFATASRPFDIVSTLKQKL